MNEPARKCGNCRFFQRAGVFLPGDQPGTCQWIPPPYVERLMMILYSEQALRVDYHVMHQIPPETSAESGCSMWRLKGHATDNRGSFALAG